MEFAGSGPLPAPHGPAAAPTGPAVAVPDPEFLSSLDNASLHALLDALPLWVWTADALGTVDFMNHALRMHVQPGPGGRVPPWTEMLHAEDAEPALAGWRTACRMQEPLELECRLRCGQDEATRWVQLRASPLFDAAGGLVRWFGTVVDIHDRHMSERRNRKLAKRLVRTLESITDGFFTLDPQWRFTYVNHACERMLQRPREELLGQDIREAVPVFRGSEFEQRYAQAFAEQRAVRFESLSKVSQRWLGVWAYPGEDGLSVYFADITPQHEAREEERARLGVLQIQREIASASGLGLEALMGLVAQRTRALMQADGCEVLLIEGGRLVSRAAQGRTVLALGGEASPSGLSAAAARGTGVIYAPDALADARVDHALAQRIGVRSMVAAPLRAGDQPQGVLLVTSARTHAFAPRDIANLEFLSQSLGAIIQRQLFDARLQASEAKYRMLFDNNPHPMWVLRPSDLRILAVNRSAERHYGYTQQQFLALHANQLWDSRDPDEPARHIAHIRANQTDRQITQRHRRADGSVIDVEIHADPIVFDGEPGRLVLALDVTERLRAQELQYRLAFFDALTQLPNRQRMAVLLDEALAHSAASGLHGALLFVDLDNFKTINDTLGHDQGDELLRSLAARLRDAVAATDVVARFGSDEFLVLLPPVHPQAMVARSHAIVTAEVMLQALVRPYRLRADELVCTSSIGVAPFGPATRDAGELLRQTDLALHEAKLSGRNTLRVFEDRLQQQALDRARLESELRQALADCALEVHFQPQAEGDKVLGFEALVRWPRADGSMVSPAQFIPLAEETGLILGLGLWVLEQACTLVASWRDAPALRALSVAVNVSARQFHHHGFLGQLRDVLTRTGAAPQQIKLELTEGMLVEDVEGVIAKMRALRDLGVRISLDDFGTGYSSLTYLRRLPLDQLKIDQSFVREVLADPRDAAIARAIITLGQSLGLQVIAEGVEQEAQRAMLVHNGCTAYQGYLLARPMPLSALAGFMEQHGAPGTGAAMREALARIAARR